MIVIKMIELSVDVTGESKELIGFVTALFGLLIQIFGALLALWLLMHREGPGKKYVTLDPETGLSPNMRGMVSPSRHGRPSDEFTYARETI